MSIKQEQLETEVAVKRELQEGAYDDSVTIRATDSIPFLA